MNNPTNPPHEHEYLEEILTPVALGIPSEQELAEAQALLQKSAAARAEFASLQALAADLSLLAEERAPSAGLRERLALAVQADAPAQEPSASASPTPIEPIPFTAATPPETQSTGNVTSMRPYLTVAAAAAVVLALIGGILLDRFVLQDDSGTAMQEIAYTLTLPGEAPPDLSANLLYDPDEQLFMLKTSNMPAAPEGQVYQIWLIDHEGVPQPKGKMDEPEFAVAANRDDYAAFAITTEPGPFGSEDPTSDPFFVAPLAPEGTN